jgi:hypothetical protein
MSLNFKKLSVLVIEDTGPMRKLLESVLRRMGGRVSRFSAANRRILSLPTGIWSP